MELGDLVEFLGDVGLGELEVCFVRGEEFGTGVGVEGMGGHGDRVVGCFVGDCSCEVRGVSVAEGCK